MVRDVRRRYPQLSTVTQADAVALLEVGSAANPKQELIGEAGSKQLVAAQEAGTQGLSVAFEKNAGLAKDAYLNFFSFSQADLREIVVSEEASTVVTQVRLALISRQTGIK